MFTLTGSEKNADHYACISTDEKPFDESIRNGSDAIEMDTSEVFMFDGGIKRWRNLSTGEAVGPAVLKIQTQPAMSGILVTAQMTSRSSHDVKTGITDSNGHAEIEISEYGTYTVSTDYSKDVEVAVNGPADYDVNARIAKVYGASWDGTATTKWKRTGNAALFANPNPYVEGSNSYGSPFDNIMPWAGMVKEERAGGTMVAIPKFYYNLLKNKTGGLDISISNEPVHGFYVSPAHMDRGDGKGERDVVYIGRYKCSEENYRSEIGNIKTRETLSEFRSGIHGIGENVWQADFAIWLTIRLLYLVEFANWSSQKVIGFGVVPADHLVNDMGYTDSMPYHTGTMKSSRKERGPGVQYRNIEGLWETKLELRDGCYLDESGLNVILNPSKFSDSEGGISIGIPSSGYPIEFEVSDSAGFPVFYPTNTADSQSTFFTDAWRHDLRQGSWFSIGADYTVFENSGIFAVYTAGRRGAGSNSIGSRIQELP